MVANDSRTYKKKVYHSVEYITYLLELFEGKISLEDIMNTDLNILMSMREAKEKQLKRREQDMKKIQRGQDPSISSKVDDNEHGYLRPL